MKEKILNVSAFKKLEQKIKRLSHYLENISKDFMRNRQLKYSYRKAMF